ncbi:DUF983 domain-containing protein [Phyllobacterium sp. SYP-B3895]|jgi:uncharacterized protein (DUF983 family)|uniref:DUF983 domain-containing protein n=1 Tax=Phyllobacterium pellucidum TaxID=2740464 RepID=A0A849VI02_9HYPH|nr:MULTISPECIES: DUF983 domain-containing protein [Phyllobacterium]MRG55593.1 DUF983 domain-containing protein [Phyllobacterium sp. SYP-B3895]NTS29825.1 DUF983 domain-containing protein [Phyllobacterium pellucidum]
MTTIQTFGAGTGETRPARPVGQAMWRGFRCRCPNCGEGKLFRAFVKSVDNCSVCGEDFTHQRADDFPAYITITIVGHVVLGGFLAVETLFILSNWVHLAIWVPLTIIMSIALLQPIKGAIIGLQWANYMHGFGGETDDLEPSDQ